MSHKTRWFHFAIALAGAGYFASSAGAAPPAIYNLGTLGGSTLRSYGNAINGAGRVAGGSYSAAGEERAFRYVGTPGSGGMIQDLGALGSGGSWGYAINASGQVAGHTYTSSSFSGHAFRYDGTPGSGGIMRDLGTLSGPNSVSYAQATGINASGQVAGFSYTESSSSSASHAFRTTGTPGVAGYVMHDLFTLGGTRSYAYAINDSGQVAGEALKSGDTASHAFRTTGTPGVAGYVMHDLGTLGGTSSSANAINASGQVAGYSDTTGNAATHAFRYTGTPGSGGIMRDLGTLGGTESFATGINTAGGVVGYGDPPDGGEHAFLHLGTPTASMIDLDAWLDINNPAQGAKWTLTRAQGLNDSLLIVGTGEYDANADGIFDAATDGTRAFVLDASSAAVPQPKSLSLLAICGVAVLRRGRLRVN